MKFYNVLTRVGLLNMDMYTKIYRSDRIHGIVLKQNKIGNLEYLTFPILEKTGIVEHLFTTRTGGVSKGIYSSMNLSFTRGDEEQDVIENYRRIAGALGKDIEDIVTSDQTHTTNIRRVTDKDCGKGIVIPRDYTDIDGLITNVPGVVLATFFADCVPLYFVDVEHEAIGLAHSGWRGTVAGMGKCMVKAMEREFDSKPENIYAAIGPSICQDCYEVSKDVAEEFEKILLDSEEILAEIRESGILTDSNYVSPKLIEQGRTEDKYQLNLWLANLFVLRKANIPLNNIAVTDICTCHNPDYLFSHRASKGKRGNLGAFLVLR